MTSAKPKSPIAAKRNVSTMAMVRRRSVRSAMTPPISENSSHGSVPAAVTSAMVVGEREIDLARSGSAAMITPSPRFEMAPAVHRRAKLGPNLTRRAIAATLLVDCAVGRGCAEYPSSVAAFPELAILRTELNGDALAHLERLAVSWRLLSDLSFSDLLLLAPIAHEDGHRFVILAQVRPTTGQTLYVHDLVGHVVDEVERPALARSWRHSEIFEGDASILGGKERVRLQSVPVRYRGREIAVLTREAPTTSGRRPGELERYYLEVYDRLVSMVADGTFPFAREEVEIEGAPRVGDGVIVLDADGGMRYASPNAVSSLHRIGIHAYTSGVRLGEIGFDEAAVDTAVRGRLPVIEEVEREDASVLVRVIPLLDGWKPAGALVLLRDVTDLRRRDRMLMSKDATIREIHHRVKNNLQTIASLLRLQGRRVDSPEARTALAGVGAADPVDRDRARDAVTRGARVRRLRSDHQAARAAGGGVGVDRRRRFAVRSGG